MFFCSSTIEAKGFISNVSQTACKVRGFIHLQFRQVPLCSDFILPCYSARAALSKVADARHSGGKTKTVTLGTTQPHNLVVKSCSGGQERESKAVPFSDHCFATCRGSFNQSFPLLRVYNNLSTLWTNVSCSVLSQKATLPEMDMITTNVRRNYHYLKL